jgi:methionine-rich copper-binding protein CopC
MFRSRPLALPALILLAMLVVTASAPGVRGAEIRRHTRLVKSEPANNDTLANSPTAIRLWFSEKVELPVTRLKLADAAGTAIALSPPARPETGDDAPVVSAVKKALPAGAYVLSWSTAAKDGHPAKGTISFFVKAAR